LVEANSFPDNKYKCEKCGGKFVDAVRRTCLKEIPDHLILHLKRFEYDISLQRRNKINDHFEFPMNVDMSQYTFDHLSNPEAPVQPDDFELVGVLIHKGQAEHGHYISYIRGRDRVDSNEASWYQFDDSDVTVFDSKEIPETCFGGYSDGKESHYTQPHYKSYNAYMLFYQRASSIKGLQKSLAKLLPEIPDELDNDIAWDNSRTLRTYCLLEPAHQAFVSSLCDELKNNVHAKNSAHALQKDIISVCWSHMLKVSSRSKEIDGFVELLNSFSEACRHCDNCAYLAVTWLFNHPAQLNEMLLRTTNAKVRAEMQLFVLRGFEILRQNETIYGTNIYSNTPETNESGLAFLEHAVSCLVDFSQRDIHYHARCWDEYFGLMASIAALGAHECWMMLQYDLLTYCLEYLTINVDYRLGQKYPKVLQLFKKKIPPHNNLTDVFWRMLINSDLRCRVSRSERSGRFDPTTMKYPITNDDHRMMSCYVQEDGYVFLSRLFERWDISRETKEFTPGLVLLCLVQHHTNDNVLHRYLQMIKDGVSTLSAAYAEPYIRAAAYFCMGAPDPELVRSLVATLTTAAIENEGQNGLSIARFFADVSRLENHTVPESADGKPPFYRLVLVRASKFGPALLGNYADASVRLGTLQLLQILLFEAPPMDDLSGAGPNDIERCRAQQVRRLMGECNNRVATMLEKESPKGVLYSFMIVLKDCAAYLHAVEQLGPVAEKLRDSQDEDLLETFSSMPSPLTSKSGL
jgi:ubiquitin carboxyl-terminal hydrolase 34